MNRKRIRQMNTALLRRLTGRPTAEYFSGQPLLERLESLNRDLGATILMVTHDAFTASCCRRVIFLRDGQIFTQLLRQGDRRDFFRQIMDVVAQLGGEVQNVL